MSIKVTKSSMPDYEEYCMEIKELWESHWLTNMGVKHKKLQGDLESYLDANHVTLFTNGHLALENAIDAMLFEKGSEVITTPFTFISTTHAIVRCGLVPVFCDINPVDYTIDVDKIESLITDKTVAIIPVHVYGNICNVGKIQEIADRHNLKVIYDAAHAFGVKVNGESVANFGDMSMFSFHATKVFNTIEGGAVCYNDDKYVTILNDLKNFGIRGPEDNHYVAGNAKMSEFQAAMGICNLRHVDSEIAKRKLAVQRYRKNLCGVKGIKLLSEQEGVESNYAYFPVVFDGYKYDRDSVYEKLKANDIIARKYFYPLTNDVTVYKDYPTANADKTPVAKDISSKVLTLPLYADLTNNEVDLICKIILE